MQVGNHSQSMTNMELSKQENEFLGIGDPNLTDRTNDKSPKKKRKEKSKPKPEEIDVYEVIRKREELKQSQTNLQSEH